MIRASKLGGYIMKSRISMLIVALLLTAFSAGEQEQRGVISGVVSDPQSAVVPNAVVTVVDNGTGAVFTAKTSAVGAFTVPGLSFGTYSVTISAPGFSTWETKNV